MARQMKQWRIYEIFEDGRERCANRSYNRYKAEMDATVLSLLCPAGVVAIEMRSPDGRYWTRPVPKGGSREQREEAERKLLALPPDELQRRKAETIAKLVSFFRSEEPPISDAAKRGLEQIELLRRCADG